MSVFMFRLERLKKFDNTLRWCDCGKHAVAYIAKGNLKFPAKGSQI